MTTHFSACRTPFRKTGIFLASLIILAALLYATGVYDRVRDSLSLRDACQGLLAQDALNGTLGSGRARAEDTTQSAGGGEGALVGCQIRSDDGSGKADLDIRWADGLLDQDDQQLLPARSDTNSYSQPVSPLGNGWPGVSSQDHGTLRVSLTLPCQKNRNKSLLVSGLLSRDDSSKPSQAHTSFAQLTTATAKKAAGRFGCNTTTGRSFKASGKNPDRISPDPLDQPRDVEKAQGTCAALRPFAARAKAAGVPIAGESPTGTKAPATDCFLSQAGEDGLPGYRVSALYAPYSQLLRQNHKPLSPNTNLQRAAGVSSGDKHYVWGSAQCPGSKQRALYLMYDLSDPITYRSAVPHPSRGFEKSVLKAFAKKSAAEHGCSDLRVP